MNDNGNNQELVGPRPTDAQSALLAAGHTILRLENDTQMAVALQRPRDEKKILADALTELDTYPSAAAEALYCKPTGRLAKCPHCGAETHYKEACPRCSKLVPETYAENLSIRTAESLANRWGNNAYGVQYEEAGDEYGIVSAVFLDYETNSRRIMQRRVSKFYKRRGSNQVVQLTPDKFDLKVAADGSRVLREVILRSLPSGLKREYYLKAYSMLGKSGDVKARIQRMLAEFSRFGVTMEMIEGLVGKALAQFDANDVTQMIGVYNTIKEGESSVADVFPTDGKKEEQPGVQVAGGTPAATRPNGEPPAPAPPVAAPPTAAAPTQAPAPQAPPEAAPPAPAWQCKVCQATADDPPVYHKGRYKGRRYCPECGSTQIAQVTPAAPPETPAESVPGEAPNWEETPIAPQADPTTAKPAEPATEPAPAATASPPAASPAGDKKWACVPLGHTFSQSEIKPRQGTQFGICPKCLTSKIQPLPDD